MESLDGAHGGAVRGLWRACGVCVGLTAGCARARLGETGRRSGVYSE
ncbi:hypothetical protein OH686_14835 [Pseudomonas sp. SO81]|nr:hypothetical protein OH686_14835 [Pseudomonas sp. SO81]